ncbi:MAG: TetR/AcrR family transcriptional regulator [Pseudomonadales bacterium]|nr:TetR/AcrR family transcriptional regulator [Pseudomonadales bacterium]
MSLNLNEKPVLSATQTQIVDAAIRCVKQLGIERVTLNDIAKEAKVARSTVYSHYANKEEVVRFALLQSAYSFAEKMVMGLLDIPAGAERIIEAVSLCLRSLPDEPCLVLITDTTLTQMVNEHTLTTEAGFDINTQLFQFLVGEHDLTEAQVQEQAEFTIRTMFSLLMMLSPGERSDEELRGFVARWLLPALDLQIPEQYRLNKKTIKKEVA